MKLVSKVIIRNPLGLHARPASEIARVLQGYSCRVVFCQDGRTADAGSVVEVLMLAAGAESTLTIEVEGENAAEVMKLLEEKLNEKTV